MKYFWEVPCTSILNTRYVYKKKVLTDKFNMKRLDVVDVILKIKYFKIYDRFVLS
jgi:hypothetical protein